MHTIYIDATMATEPTMTELATPTESKVEFSISYASTEKFDDHSIDVEILAPSIIATNNFLREVNRELNAKSSNSILKIVSNFEHRCFNINFELITSAIDTIKPLIESERVKTSKELLEWIGIVAGATGLSGFSLMKFLKWKKGRKVTETVRSNKVGENAVNVSVEGENASVTVNRNIYNLSENPRVMRYMRDIFTPIGVGSFNRVDFIDANNNATRLEEFDVKDIISSCNQTIAANDNEEIEVEEITAWLSVYSPVFDEKADKWRFKFGKDHIYADISETNIAKDALKRGGISVNDSYQVLLEISTPAKKSKNSKQSYRVLKVLKFIPGPSGSQETLEI